MGEEYGESAPFQYFVDHGDGALIDAVRRGRREEFARFGWEGDIPDPQAESTFLDCKLNWELQTVKGHRILWEFYQELLRMRREVSPLAQLNKSACEVTSLADERVLSIRRWDDSCQVLIACHFDRTPTKLVLPIPAGRWQRALDSAEARWDGNGSQTPAVLQLRGELQVSLGPWAFLVLAQDAESEE